MAEKEDEMNLLESYGLTPARGSIGKIGFFTSTHSDVRISAQLTDGHIFLVRLDAVTPGHGAGGAALERLKRFAHDSDRIIRLIAAADTLDLQPHLNKFYATRGFIQQDDNQTPEFVWTPTI
jgi:hypothetical protein